MEMVSSIVDELSSTIDVAEQVNELRKQEASFPTVYSHHNSIGKGQSHMHVLGHVLCRSAPF